MIDMRADPADHLVAAPGEEILMLGMFVERVLAGGQQAIDLVLERRDPGGIVGINGPGQVDECLEVGLAGDGVMTNSAVDMAPAPVPAPVRRCS